MVCVEGGKQYQASLEIILYESATYFPLTEGVQLVVRGSVGVFHFAIGVDIGGYRYLREQCRGSIRNGRIAPR